MDALGRDRRHVAGHDRGARVGHRMALDRPERVASFISLDLGPLPGQPSKAWTPPSRSHGFHWNLMRQPSPAGSQIDYIPVSIVTIETLRRINARLDVSKKL